MMHAQTNHSPEDENRLDRTILGMLLADGERELWAVDEVAREVGDQFDVTDALARLYGAGLIHRCGEFVIASRAAVKHAQIVG